MKPRQRQMGQGSVELDGPESSALALVPQVDLYASDLCGHRTVEPLVSWLTTQGGVREVTLNADGGAIRVRYDPDITGPELLVRSARGLGYGVCIVTARFDLGERAWRNRRTALAAALRRSYGILTAQIDAATNQLTVTYIPGPTDTGQVRDRILRLAHDRIPGGRQRQTRRHRPSPACRQSH